MQDPKIGRSHVEFGSLDKYAVRGDDLSKLSWMGVQKDFFWSIYTWGISFGDRAEGPNAWKLASGVYSILDTGSSHIFVPSNYWQVFIDKMIE